MDYSSLTITFLILSNIPKVYINFLNNLYVALNHEEVHIMVSKRGNLRNDITVMLSGTIRRCSVFVNNH